MTAEAADPLAKYIVPVVAGWAWTDEFGDLSSVHETWLSARTELEVYIERLKEGT